MVEKSEANCRQLLSRARQRVAERRPRFKASVGQHQRLVDAFLKAANEGDVAGFLAILAEDVVFVTDGGGEPQAPRRPVRGIGPVSRLLLQGAQRERAALTVTRPVFVNGWPGFVAYRGAVPRSAVAFDIDDGRIRAIYLVANPAKLQRLRLTHPPG